MPCLFLQQPIGYIMDLNSFIAIFRMPGSGNHHLRISISNLKKRSAFSFKCFLPGNVVAYLNIDLLAASLSNKVDLLLIEFTDIDIVSTAKKLDANDVFIYSTIIHISASQDRISNAAVTQIELFRAFKVFAAECQTRPVPQAAVLRSGPSMIRGRNRKSLYCSYKFLLQNVFRNALSALQKIPEKQVWILSSGRFEEFLRRILCVSIFFFGLLLFS